MKHQSKLVPLLTVAVVAFLSLILFQNCGGGGALFSAESASSTLQAVGPQNSIATWATGSWTACSQVCGGGSQSRVVQCLDKNSQPIARANCVAADMPKELQACNAVNQQACVAANGVAGTRSCSAGGQTWGTCVAASTSACGSSFGPNPACVQILNSYTGEGPQNSAPQCAETNGNQYRVYSWADNYTTIWTTVPYSKVVGTVNTEIKLLAPSACGL